VIGMPSEFWAGWIAVITIATLVALLWLVLSVYFAPASAGHAPEQTWDETLREGATPAPLWWFWLILALLAVSVVYLLLYPGLGRFPGVLGWSQDARLAASTARYAQLFGESRARLLEASIDQLQANDIAMVSAVNVFRNHCSACHGVDGQGAAQLFPNLRDADWQWGGSQEQIEQSISLGRQAVMPPWQTVLGDLGVAQVADYVVALASGDASSTNLAAGRDLFALYCTACHGAGGAGVAALGGPALDDSIWLYGGTPIDVRHSVASGRDGQMPPFGERLDPLEIRLLVAWLAGSRPSAR
jgi:cytochrome c oxidase cbb3-type subunit 3